MSEFSPAEMQARHRAYLDDLPDTEILRRLSDFAPLPQVDGDSDPIWQEDETLDKLMLYLTFADIIGERKLVEGIRPLFERAGLEDGFGLLQGLRHGAEAATASDRELLPAIIRPLLNSPSPGCRRWTVRELGVTRDVSSVPGLLACLRDPEVLVRREACMSLLMIARDNGEPALRSEVRSALLVAAGQDTDPSVREDATENAAELG